MESWLRSLFSGRPAWMNALMVFSAYMAIIYVPWDFFVKPVAVDEEVWFGLMFHGWAAKLAQVSARSVRPTRPSPCTFHVCTGKLRCNCRPRCQEEACMH